MSDTTLILLQKDAAFRPYFNTSVKILAFFTTFFLFLAVQMLAAWGMYESSRTEVRQVLERELASIANSGASALAIAAERSPDRRMLLDMVWRIQRANRLGNALLVDARMTTPAPGDGEGGVPVSALSATPALVRRVCETGESALEECMLYGERHVRHYRPVPIGPNEEAGRNALVVEAHDPAPAALAALELPLFLAIGSAAVSALSLALVVVLLMRFFDRSKREMLRMERLATAGEFASSIAHEVKNPMGFILTGTQMLREESNLTDDQRETLDGIAEEVKRAEGQLDSFLDLARDVPIKPRTEDMSEVVTGTLSLVDHKLRKYEVEVVAKMPEDPILAFIDRRKMRQAIVNLILNSLDSFGGRKGRITVSLRRDADDVPELTIADDGRGIAPEHLARVTEPFYSTRQTGTGLGLPQSIKIVERHGGSLLIDSAPGRGTTVAIRLPVPE